MIDLIMNPVIGVFIFGLVISLVMTLINKKFLGSGKAKEVREKMNELREEMLKFQKSGDMKKVNEYLARMMKLNNEYMKFSFKPLIISFVIAILVLPLLNMLYTGKVVATIPNTIPVIGGFQLSWIWWYIIVSLVLGLIFRKLIGV